MLKSNLQATLQIITGVIYRTGPFSVSVVLLLIFLFGRWWAIFSTESAPSDLTAGRSAGVKFDKQMTDHFVLIMTIPEANTDCF
jgi:hypothetical protein